MSSFLQLSLVSIATLLVAAMPRAPVDLATVMEKTTCPMKLVLDIDHARIPRVIKTLRCAEDPLQNCRSRIPDYECCQRRRDGVRMSCMEVEDSVLVHYPRANVTDQRYRVAVACACVMEEITRLEEPAPT